MNVLTSFSSAARLTVQENTFSSLKKVKIERMSIEEGENEMSQKNKAIGVSGSYMYIDNMNVGTLLVQMM